MDLSDFVIFFSTETRLISLQNMPEENQDSTSSDDEDNDDEESDQLTETLIAQSLIRQPRKRKRPPTYHETIEAVSGQELSDFWIMTIHRNQKSAVSTPIPLFDINLVTNTLCIYAHG